MGDHTDLVLIVEDENLLRRSLEAHLRALGYDVVEAADARAARARLRERAPDVVLLDSHLPDATPGALLPEIRAAIPEVPVIVMTAHATVDGTIAAFHQGAWDFLPKPFEGERVSRLVANALETTRLRRELRRARAEVAGQLDPGIVARSGPMREALEVAARVAAHGSATVLIEGESGTGKGLLAQAIHGWSDRRAGPFLTVTCSAIPSELLESELFGHVQGAFTGATVARPGMVAAAAGGTLFLDEIGDMAPALQAKILHLLEERQFRPLGSTREEAADVRIVAATNRDLADAVDAGAFREDLYYRLKVVPIRLPALRERLEDLPALAQQLLERANADVGRPVAGFTSEAVDAMTAYPWPGNVRELRNAIERALVVGDAPQIRFGDLPAEVRGERSTAAGGDVPLFALPPGGVELEAVERDFVRQALRRTGGNRTEAGKLLGINRDGVRYRIRKYGLERTRPGGTADAGGA